MSARDIVVIARYRANLEEDPHNGEMHNYLGKLLFKSGQKKDALTHLRKALILKECDSEGCYLLSLLHEDKRRF